MITRKQAKIYALRWALGSLEQKPDLSNIGNFKNPFTPYEEEKFMQEINKILDSIENRLFRLGDNPSLQPWQSPHVRNIKQTTNK